MTQARQAIRAQIRNKRQNLSTALQQTAALGLLTQLKNRIQAAKPAIKHIALYLANDGELNTEPSINWCWQHNISVYLPVIHPFSKGYLLFLQYTPDTVMVKNQYGILEPKLNILTMKTAKQLDVIFTPLVAFDDKGNRLGMGGGFYDRTLASINPNQTAVIGLAHSCQQIPKLPIETWDIPLPEIITPEKHFIFSS